MMICSIPTMKTFSCMHRFAITFQITKDLPILVVVQVQQKSSLPNKLKIVNVNSNKRGMILIRLLRVITLKVLMFTWVVLRKQLSSYGTDNNKSNPEIPSTRGERGLQPMILKSKRWKPNLNRHLKKIITRLGLSLYHLMSDRKKMNKKTLTNGRCVK